MSVTKQRLSNRQIATLKHLAVCCQNGGLVTLTRDQREAMVPLWRRDLVEIWNRSVPGEQPRGPFFRPSEAGWHLINAIIEGGRRLESEAA